MQLGQKLEKSSPVQGWGGWSTSSVNRRGLCVWGKHVVSVCVVFHACLLLVVSVHRPNHREGAHRACEQLWDVYCRISARRAQLPTGYCSETTPKSEVVDLDLLGNWIKTKIDSNYFLGVASNFTHFSSLYYFSISFWDLPTALFSYDLVEKNKSF